MQSRSLWPFLVVTVVVSPGGQQFAAAQGTSLTAGQHENLTRYDGPPLTLRAALAEVLEKNPELVALRAELQAARERPAQERSLAPPMFEATIWQWPVNT